MALQQTDAEQEAHRRKGEAQRQEYTQEFGESVGLALFDYLTTSTHSQEYQAVELALAESLAQADEVTKNKAFLRLMKEHRQNPKTPFTPWTTIGSSGR